MRSYFSWAKEPSAKPVKKTVAEEINLARKEAGNRYVRRNTAIKSSQNAGIKTRKAQVMTIRNLIARESDKKYVNLSITHPSENFIIGESIMPVITSVINTKAQVIIEPNEGDEHTIKLKYFDDTKKSLYLPLPHPERKIGERKNVKPLIRNSGEQTAWSVSHNFGRNKFTISYEAKVYIEDNTAPFVYFLDIKEFIKDEEDGYKIYIDIPKELLKNNNMPALE